jgi:hypothetical protein
LFAGKRSSRGSGFSCCSRRGIATLTPRGGAPLP